MKIYADYTEEPEDSYDFLDAERYRELYDLEMAEFRDDLPFYLSNLAAKSRILELGCGSGRLSRLLTTAGHQVTGIDHSRQMLQEAATKCPSMHRVRMDMRNLGFRSAFDAVIIPYNTLNLLHRAGDVHACLQECRRVLKPCGTLLLQLYALPPDLADSGQTDSSFQFQMFDRPQGGKVIKEILRQFQPDRSLITMTERYKIRPMTPGCANRNFSRTFQLMGWSASRWLGVIELAGFCIKIAVSSYQEGTGSTPGLLLIMASSREERLRYASR